jgi:hypothetical protein
MRRNRTDGRGFVAPCVDVTPDTVVKSRYTARLKTSTTDRSFRFIVQPRHSLDAKIISITLVHEL